MFKFITNRPLWVNILAGILLAFGLLTLCVFSLGWFTNHDDAKTVPSVLGKKLPEAQKILEKAGFTVEIQDSVYIDSLPPLQVIRQVPDDGEVVKSNRAVYLTYNRSEPPLIEMPNIVGYSLRNAEMLLKNAGLKLGDTTFRPDFAINTVLEQHYNGVMIQPGAKIRAGSRVDLVIATGLGNAALAVPNLIGLTYQQALAIMDSSRISLASIILDPGVTDTASGYIYRQNPGKFDDEGHLHTIRQGQTMDIWIGKDRPVTDSPKPGKNKDNPADSSADNEN